MRAKAPEMAVADPEPASRGKVMRSRTPMRLPGRASGAVIGEDNMSDRVVERGDWAALADGLSRQLKGAQAEIEVAALGFGDQIQAEWVPLLGLAYDPKDDIFEVAVAGLDHIIHDPDSLVIQMEGAVARNLAIGTRGGDRHILRFREALRLAPPRAEAP